jgi:hypothetical protein
MVGPRSDLEFTGPHNRKFRARSVGLYTPGYGPTFAFCDTVSTFLLVSLTVFGFIVGIGSVVFH